MGIEEETVVCGILEEFVNDCNNSGDENNKIESWRSENFCPMVCEGENQEFKTCQKSACHATTNYCAVDQESCDSSNECSEGCFCVDGFLLAGDGSCVVDSECNEGAVDYREIIETLDADENSGVDSIVFSLVSMICLMALVF